MFVTRICLVLLITDSLCTLTSKLLTNSWRRTPLRTVRAAELFKKQTKTNDKEKKVALG